MALKMMPVAAALAGCAVLLGSTLSQATAETERGNETLKKYCTGDYLQYCGNFNRDDPRLDQCFKTNWKKLSENCRRAIDAYAPAAPSGKRG